MSNSRRWGLRHGVGLSGAIAENQSGDRRPQRLLCDLFNMGHIFLQNQQIQEAVQAWITVYRLTKPIGLAQALQALTELASSLGLPGGLQGWERLSQQLGDAA